jgi:hypothetical protein
VKKREKLIKEFRKKIDKLLKQIQKISDECIKEQKNVTEQLERIGTEDLQNKESRESLEEFQQIIKDFTSKVQNSGFDFLKHEGVTRIKN